MKESTPKSHALLFIRYRFVRTIILLESAELEAVHQRFEIDDR